jgi:hypothetical protein
MTTYTSRKAADAAARREMRKIHGASYQPKAGVDFLVTRAPAWVAPFGWVFAIINEAAHRAA